MFYYILFILYTAFFCWWIPRIPFVKKAGLHPTLLLGLILLKIAAGIAVGWSALHFTGIDNDYWDANKFGWTEYQLLMNDPKEYFSNIFRTHYENGYTNVFDSYSSYWNDLRNNLVIKFVSILDIFTRGNYYVNSIFFSVIGFFGHIALYRVFLQLFQDKRWLVLMGCFLLPSMLFYSSGMHKDSIIFFAVGMVSYLIFDSLNRQLFTLKRVLAIISCLMLIFLIRNFILLAMLPALTALIISSLKKWSPFRTFIITYAITGILFFNLNSIIPSFNLPDTIARRQWDFKNQPWAGVGITDIYLNTLYPNFRSFVNNTPQALNHSMMRPYITETITKTLIPFALELLFYQALLILFLLFRRKTGTLHPFILFGIFFSLVVFLNIGYTIPNIGSIIRYRSLYLPFLITPLLCLINWEKIAQLIQFKK